MKEESIVCIVCPNSCRLTVTADDSGVKVSGNKCKRGEKFAVDEMTRPMRTICSTVKTVFSESPVLPVRVSADIPKDKIFEVMKEINRVRVSERIGRGDTVIENVLGLGVNVVATSDMLKGD